ncbi:MAG: cytochrome c [Nitrolancea sp.]
MVRLLALMLAVAVFGACGSTTVATPTPTRTGAVPAASPVGTPGAGLAGPAAKGQQLFVQYKCGECHSLSGERIVGPPLNGLYSSTVALTNGKTVVADDAYLKLALIEPDSQIVNGYPSGVMSSHIQQFETDLESTQNLDALIAYIKSLK